MNPEPISALSKLVLTFTLALVVATPRAEAQAFSVIYDFAGLDDGGQPLAGLTIDAAGNLYGTASVGGSWGPGTVFKVTEKGKETVLYSFTGKADGGSPQAALIMDTAGNLYGTTYAGGDSSAGTVFKVTGEGEEAVLYGFAGNGDGANPKAALVMDASGNLYGTTSAGGSSGNGTVFELSPENGGTWKETVLYSFGSGTDGAIPFAGVTFDTTGNLYGTTSAGGAYGYGTVFQLKPSGSGWKERILHDFRLKGDGGVPYAGVIVDPSGNLYGAAISGGHGEYGGGTVFELVRSRGRWTFKVLHRLSGWTISGPFQNLLLGASGNIYGTTHCDGANEAGTVFELKHLGGTWKYRSLYEFTGGTDGLFSFSNLVFDKHGNLYGTTKQGGAGNGVYGVVFKIKP